MTRWQRRLRIGLGIFVVIFAVAVYLAMRRQPPPRPATRQIVRGDAKVVSQLQRGTLKGFKGGKIDYTIDYDTILEYSAAASKIRGVRATFAGRNGRDLQVTGDEASVAPDQSSFSITGNVRLTSSDGLQLTTADASYAQAEDIVRAPGKVDFVRGTQHGSGVGMTYDQKRDIVTFADQFEAIDTGGQGQPPSEAHAATVTWNRADKTTRLERNARLVRGNQTLEADVAMVYMTPDEQHLQMIQLQGHSRISGAASAAPAASGGTTSAASPNAFRSMQARDINLTYAEDGERLKEAMLAGDGTVDVVSSGNDAPTRIAGEYISFGLEADGTTMRSLSARGANRTSPARLDMPGQAKTPRRVVRALTIQAPVPGRPAVPGRGLTTIRFAGDVVFNEAPPPPAELRTATARSLDLSLQPGFGTVDEALFSGEVQLTEGQSLNANARNARYDVKADTFDLTGTDDKGSAPQVKDEQATIVAPHIIVSPDRRKVSATGGVQTTMQPAQKRPDGKAVHTPSILAQDQPAFATSDELAYDGDASQATFMSKGESRLWQQKSGTAIYANQIAVDDAKGDLRAKGGVTSTLKLDRTDSKTKKTETSVTTIRADDLVYEDAPHRATYTGHVTMKGGAEGNLKTDNRVVLFLTDDGRSLHHLEAYATVPGNVELDSEGTGSSGRRRATGDRLTYTAADERYYMTGKLVKMSEECFGESEGRTFTFYKSIDRMIIDGDSERRTQTKGAQSAPGCKGKEAQTR